MVTLTVLISLAKVLAQMGVPVCLSIARASGTLLGSSMPNLWLLLWYPLVQLSDYPVPAPQGVMHPPPHKGRFFQDLVIHCTLSNLWIGSKVILPKLACTALDGKIPLFALTGITPDISIILLFTFYQPVFYVTYEQNFPSESEERAGYWVGTLWRCNDP